jgi:5-methyltetrahydrofolate--homocysteine methyltransferase
MTTTMGEMHRLTEELSRRGLPFKVLVGGAVVTNDYAESIGASYARDAQEALKKISRILG